MLDIILILPLSYTQIVRSNADSATDLSFLIYSGKNNKILVFCSRIGLRNIVEFTKLACWWDIPYGIKIFLPVIFSSRLVYVSNDVFALMNKRTIKDYNIVIITLYPDNVN